MDWLQIFVNLVLTGILLYIFQRIIDERSAKRLEKFKAELQSTAFEQETRFSKLHEKRAEVIEELYNKLVKVQRALFSLLYEFASEKNKYDTIGPSKIIEEFNAYFEANQIYLPENICSHIGRFHTIALSSWLSFVSAQNNASIALLKDLDANDYQNKIKDD